jgi:hypothetical protein
LNAVEIDLRVWSDRKETGISKNAIHELLVIEAARFDADRPVGPVIGQAVLIKVTAGGVIDGAQMLEPARLKEALFRSPNAAETGVPVAGSSSTSALGAPQLGTSKPLSPSTRRYAHGFWGKHLTPAEFPNYSCDFWVSLMVGYGGNIVALLPTERLSTSLATGWSFPGRIPCARSANWRRCAADGRISKELICEGATF